MVTENKSVFVSYFGASPSILVLDFFIENDLFDYSKTDIHRHTGVARTTLQPVIAELVEKELLIKTREVGRAGMFKLNRGNVAVEEIVKLAIKLAANSAKQEHERAPVEIKMRE